MADHHRIRVIRRSCCEAKARSREAKEGNDCGIRIVIGNLIADEEEDAAISSMSGPWRKLRPFSFRKQIGMNAML